MKKIFIDGSAGTTGLRIRERLAQRTDLEVVTLPDDVRKDVEARRAALNAADVAFLCLPDAAAIEAVSLVENPGTVVIDTSTAHRTADGWEYGFPAVSASLIQNTSPTPAATLPVSSHSSNLSSASGFFRVTWHSRHSRSPATRAAARR